MKQSRFRLTTIGPVIIFAILLVAFGALLAISARTSSTSLTNAIREVSRPITSTSSKLLFNPVYTLNITEANNVISQFVDGETIVYAAVYDGTAAKLTEVSGDWYPDEAMSKSLSLDSINTNQSQEQEIDQNLLIVTPISVGSEVIGTVVYGFDQSVLQAGLGQAQFTLTIAIISALIVASLLVYIFMRDALAPLTHLSTVAQRIGTGDLSVQVEVEGYKEIASLATAFDGMRLDLQESYADLERRVADRTQALSSVAEISTAASTILESDKLLQKVVDLSKERFGFYHAHIYLLNDAGDTLVLTSGAGEVGRQMVAEGRTIPLNQEQSLVTRAAREKKGVIVNDVTQAPDFLPNPMLPDTRSELAVPMIVGENVIGVFDVQSDVVGRFTDADISVQTTLASQVASTVQNARQYNESMQFKLGIENSGDAVFATDIKGTIIYANPAFEKVYGYTPAEVVGKNPRIIKSGLLSSENYQAFWGALLSKNSITGEIVNKHKDGRLVYIAGTNSAIVNDAGEITGFLAVHHDITEQKQNQNLAAQRARQQETINTITQKIQGATTIEDAMRVAARELGHALGQKQTLVALDPSALGGNGKAIVNE